MFILLFMENIYRLKIANIELDYSFFIPETYYYFKDFIISKDQQFFDLRTTKNDMEKWSYLVLPEESADFLEYRLMILKLSDYLCRRRACVIHSCAVMWKGLAWLFVGPSGIGKTTMYHNWKSLLGSEVEILNGDMPIVAETQDGSIRIYPSPWNGKENYGTLSDVPLGGLLFLEQGEENCIRRAELSEIVAALYAHFMCISDSKEIVRCLSKLEESILLSTPVWIFTNRGDLDSAAVSTIVISKYLKEKGNDILQI